jgi:FkbM family methyltransferase
VSRPISFALFADRRSWLRRLPSLKTRLRDRFLRRRAWAIRLEDDLVLCRVLGALNMYADPHDRSISPHLIMDGCWELDTSAVMIDLLRYGMTAIDVGANLGYFTLLMATLCGPGGKVLSFEPNPRTTRLLKQSILLNALGDRIDLLEAVVGEDDDREVDLYLPPDHPGGTQVTSLVPDGPNFIKARTRRLDAIPGALDASLVKIDAEGMEESVWRGMAAMIAGRALRYVILEFTPQSYRDGPAMLDEAAAAGFTTYLIDGERGTVPISRAEIFDGTPQRMLVLKR